MLLWLLWAGAYNLCYDGIYLSYLLLVYFNYAGFESYVSYGDLSLDFL